MGLGGGVGVGVGGMGWGARAGGVGVRAPRARLLTITMRTETVGYQTGGYNTIKGRRDAPRTRYAISPNKPQAATADFLFLAFSQYLTLLWGSKFDLIA